MKMVRTLKNEVLMRSSHKLRFKRRKCIHSIEQPLISLDLKYFMKQIKLGYLKSILQSRSSLLPSYCTTRQNKCTLLALVSFVPNFFSRGHCLITSFLVYRLFLPFHRRNGGSGEWELGSILWCGIQGCWIFLFNYLSFPQ